MNVAFLGNVQEVNGRTAIFWRLDEPLYQPGDRLVLVWKGEVEADNPAAALNVMWNKMNADDRPTGHYFRSMCAGDVILVGEQAFVVGRAGFEPLAECPVFEILTDEAAILEAM